MRVWSDGSFWQVKNRVIPTAKAVTNGAYSNFITCASDRRYKLTHVQGAVVAGDRPCTMIRVLDETGTSYWYRPQTAATTYAWEPNLPIWLEPGWIFQAYFTGGTTDGTWYFFFFAEEWIKEQAISMEVFRG